MEAPSGVRPAARLRAKNPFGETSNPAEYVPRDATEAALLAIERAVRGRRVTALIAPPGLGKSLLLKLLAERLAPGFESRVLPYAALSLEDLCAWALGLLGQPPADEPRAELLRLARQLGEEGRILALMIDDGSSMPLDTARTLGTLIRESGNRLRVVLAATDDAVSSRVVAALHPEIFEVRLVETMSPDETRLYVRTRLEQAGVDEALRGRFREAILGWIHRLSGGVPRRIHELARSVLDDVPAGVGNGWREERWLGAPIEDADTPATEDLLAEDDATEPPQDELPDLLLDEDDRDVL